MTDLEPLLFLLFVVMAGAGVVHRVLRPVPRMNGEMIRFLRTRRR